MQSRKLTAGLVLAALLQACGSTPKDDSSNLPPPGNTTVTMPDPVITQPVNTGTAGAGADKPADMKPVDMKPIDMKPVDMKPVDMKPVDMTPMAMDECGLKTTWLGDTSCIKPPDAAKGFQIHIGPTDYENPDPRYVLEPGDEVTETFPATTGNDSDVYYLYRQYRMRPGSHHLIVYGGGSGFGLGARLGGTQNLVKDDPANGKIAPENEGLGIPLSAHTETSNSLHYINLTEQPILKEVWVNFWYRDKALVKEPAIDMFSMAPMNVAPGQHVVVHGSCPISESGRVLMLYGHRHANNLRFSAWHEHGGQKDLVFEDYNWEHPGIGEYSSILTNTPPDPVKKLAGATSGILNLAPGDALSFECEIINNTDQVFVGQNEAKNDEMCIMIGDTVGATVPAFCEYSTTEL